MQPIRKRTYCSLTREFTMCVSWDGGLTFYSNRAAGVARKRELMGLDPLTGLPRNTSLNKDSEQTPSVDENDSPTEVVSNEDSLDKEATTKVKNVKKTNRSDVN